MTTTSTFYRRTADLSLWRAAGHLSACLVVLLWAAAAVAQNAQTEEAADAPAPAAEEAEGEWIQLFNGRDLTGWTPKITGYDLGDNYADTFRVEDGILKVSYDKYDGPFNGRFGHLFYNEPFSHYILRVEYRFVGDQIEGGAGWALRNSGAMVHGQAPETMAKDQNFPVSIEVQFLGGDGQGERSTGNLCTPGTHVVYNGQLHRPHVTNSSSDTFHGDQWVTVEVEARGNGTFIHRVNGETVLEYSTPQLDENDRTVTPLLEAGADKMITGGSISLQSESHPIEFRKVELKQLAPEE